MHLHFIYKVLQVIYTHLQIINVFSRGSVLALLHNLKTSNYENNVMDFSNPVSNEFFSGSSPDSSEDSSSNC